MKNCSLPLNWEKSPARQSRYYPDGILNFLPFETLRPEGPEKDGSYLIDHIAYLMRHPHRCSCCSKISRSIRIPIEEFWAWEIPIMGGCCIVEGPFRPSSGFVPIRRRSISLPSAFRGRGQDGGFVLFEKFPTYLYGKRSPGKQSPELFATTVSDHSFCRTWNRR